MFSKVYLKIENSRDILQHFENWPRYFERCPSSCSWLNMAKIIQPKSCWVWIEMTQFDNFGPKLENQLLHEKPRGHFKPDNWRGNDNYTKKIISCIKMPFKAQQKMDRPQGQNCTPWKIIYFRAKIPNLELYLWT